MRQLTHIIVRGQVQGVSFRAWTMRQAETLELHGWVRNRADGAVEAVLAGEPERIRALIEACREGPELAIVTDIVEVTATDDPGTGFRIVA
jgi:acylphosphatase